MSDNGMYRFKKLLDERGVNYDGNERKVRFSGKDGCECRAYTRPNNLYIDVTLIDVTPEQAIAAALVNDEAAELQAENEQLRELIRDMALIASCSGSKLLDMQMPAKNRDHRTIVERIRELGI